MCRTASLNEFVMKTDRSEPLSCSVYHRRWFCVTLCQCSLRRVHNGGEARRRAEECKLENLKIALYRCCKRETLSWWWLAFCQTARHPRRVSPPGSFNSLPCLLRVVHNARRAIGSCINTEQKNFEIVNCAIWTVAEGSAQKNLQFLKIK